jgi:hypothetical protein
MLGIQPGYCTAMSDDDGFDRMVEATILAHQLVAAHGTATMKLLSRLLLMDIGTEIAARRIRRWPSGSSRRGATPTRPPTTIRTSGRIRTRFAGVPVGPGPDG